MKDPLTFLDLPAEVRRMIYEAYFKHAYIVIEAPHAASMYDGDLEGMPSSHHEFFCPNQMQQYHDLWLLFLLCKQVAKEVHPIFFNTATFVFKGRRPFLSSFCRTCIPDVPQKGFLLKNQTFNPFTSIQSFWLDLTRHCWRGCKESDHEIQDNTKLAMAIIQNHLPALKHLSVTFDTSAAFFNTNDDDEGTGDEAIDLSIRPYVLVFLCRFIYLESFSIGYITAEDDPSNLRASLRQLTIMALHQVLKKNVRGRKSSAPSRALAPDGSPAEDVSISVHKAMRRVILRNKSKFGELTRYTKEWR